MKAAREADGPIGEAVLLVLASTALFGIGDAIVKLMSEHLGVAQIVLLRSSFSLLLLLAIRERGEPLVPRGLGNSANLLRSATEIGTTMIFFAGVARLPLGVCVSILFLAPVLLTAVAAFGLKERVGRQRWFAVVLGFLGVLVVIRPGGTEFTAALLLPIVSAMFITARDTVVRWLPIGIPTRSVVIGGTLALILGGAIGAPFDWRPLNWTLLLGCAACAATVTLAFLAYVKATRIAEVSFVQPFKYIAIPWSFVLGWLFWGDVPDRWGIVGALMIMVSGLIVLRRRRVG